MQILHVEHDVHLSNSPPHAPQRQAKRGCKLSSQACCDVMYAINARQLYQPGPEPNAKDATPDKMLRKPCMLDLLVS